MNNNRLTGQFPKPDNGEYVPITFIEFKRKLVGWSPELKKSVYIENEEEISKLKRVREVNVLIAINHLSGNVSSIELNDEERNHFEDVYSLYLKKGGQLIYTRKKMGARTFSIFEVHDIETKATDASVKTLLSEKI